MSLLDDARRLLKYQPLDSDGDYCRVCGEALSGYPDWNGHAPDCPWLSIPRIVAALEAAERVIATFDESSLCTTVRVVDIEFHEAIEDLAEMLRGEEVTV